jgi:hypothetical protein
MPPAAEAIANKMKLWDADVVTIFPTCTTRMDAKGVHKLLRLFAVLNRSVKAKLVLCNPNASGSKSMAVLANLRSLANTYGLTDGVLGFTSDILPKLAVHGIPSADVLALMNIYGNVFAFPSISESDSLVLLEARLARQFILVNGDAQGVGTAQAEASRLPGGCVSIPWGATATVGDTDEVATMAAQHVLGFIHSNPQEASRRAVLRTRNLEVIGNLWAEAINAAGPAP